MNDKISPPTDTVMCVCSGTKQSEVQSLFAQGLDMEAISRRTGALSGCGGCEWEIAAMLQLLAEEQNHMDPATPPGTAADTPPPGD